MIAFYCNFKVEPQISLWTSSKGAWEIEDNEKDNLDTLPLRQCLQEVLCRNKGDSKELRTLFRTKLLE